MAQPNQTNTETKLMATPKQAKTLVKELLKAIAKAEEQGEAAYVRVVLQQMTHDGPWGLTLGVYPKTGVNARD